MAQIKPENAVVMQAVAVPDKNPTNYEFRKVLNRRNMYAVQIVHDIPKTQWTTGCCQKTCRMLCPCCFIKCCTCCTCCTCGVCLCQENCEKARKEAEESTYTWVMENRVEFNRPFIMFKNDLCAMCTCSFQVVDKAFAVYYDNLMYDHVSTANPVCYSCRTWCCGSSGETIAFKAPILCCPSAKYCGTTVVKIRVTHGTGERTSQIINTARDNTRAQMK